MLTRRLRRAGPQLEEMIKSEIWDESDEARGEAANAATRREVKASHRQVSHTSQPLALVSPVPCNPAGPLLAPPLGRCRPL